MKMDACQGLEKKFDFPSQSFEHTSHVLLYESWKFIFKYFVVKTLRKKQIGVINEVEPLFHDLSASIIERFIRTEHVEGEMRILWDILHNSCDCEIVLIVVV